MKEIVNTVLQEVARADQAIAMPSSAHARCDLDPAPLSALPTDACDAHIYSRVEHVTRVNGVAA
jgi:hypothetical protein